MILGSFREVGLSVGWVVVVGVYPMVREVMVVSSGTKIRKRRFPSPCGKVFRCPAMSLAEEA